MHVRAPCVRVHARARLQVNRASICLAAATAAAQLVGCIFAVIIIEKVRA
jgi:hypothetical protein